MTARARWLAAGAVVLALLFLALGAWQLQRMGWKHALIARVQARAHAAPVALPAAGEWPRIAAQPQDYAYRRLRLQGEYLQGRDARVQAVTELGAGFWVLTPLALADGGIVLVNRGFVPATAQPAAPPPGPVAVQGLLRASEPHGAFLRRNDAAADRWHSRDVAAIAAARGLPVAAVAPFFVDADAALPAGRWPQGGMTVLRFSDNHLVYALTWFVLALMAAWGAWRVLRHGAEDGPAAA